MNIIDQYERQGLLRPTKLEIAAKVKKNLARNVANAIEVLERNSVQYERRDTTQGVIFVIRYKGKRVTYYPETGKWFDPQSDRPREFGLRNLVRYLTGGVL